MEYALGYSYELEIEPVDHYRGNVIVDGEDNVFLYDMNINEIIFRLRNKYPYLTRGDVSFIRECF